MWTGPECGSGKIIRIRPDKQLYWIFVFRIGLNVYYLYDLAMSPVVGICEEGLGQVGQEVLEYGGALVHRELVIVQVQRDSLKRLTMLGDGWSS